MSKKDEGGLFDLVMDFLSDEEGGGSADEDKSQKVACPKCLNDSARVVFRCPCGTRINLCAACLLARVHDRKPDAFQWLDSHSQDCGQFRSLYENAREKESH